MSVYKNENRLKSRNSYFFTQP